MKNIFIYTALIAILFSSCKEDELTLIHKDSGGLTVQLNDATGQPIANAKLSLYNNSFEEERMGGYVTAIDEVLTDANGYANFGVITQDTYTVVGEDIKDGELMYSFYKAAQVVSAETNSINIIPSEFSATISLALREEDNDGNYIPLGSDVKVAIVKYDDSYLKGFSRNAMFEKLSQNIVKEISADGTTYDYTFENIPLNHYQVMIYTEADYYVTHFRFYASKGETEKHEATVSSTEIRKYAFDQAFLVEEYTYNSTTSMYETLPYKNCKVQVVEASDYNNLNDNNKHYESVASISVASGTTDSNGKAVIEMRQHRWLYVVYFAQDNSYLGSSYVKYSEPSKEEFVKTIRK